MRCHETQRPPPVTARAALVNPLPPSAWDFRICLDVRTTSPAGRASRAQLKGYRLDPIRYIGRIQRDLVLASPAGHDYMRCAGVEKRIGHADRIAKARRAWQEKSRPGEGAACAARRKLYMPISP